MRLGDPKLPLGGDVGRLVVSLYDILRKIVNTVNLLWDRRVLFGAGTPEGAVTAPVGTMYLRTDGGANTTLYVKETGTGSTGWAAK